MVAMSKNQKDPVLPRHSNPQPGATAVLRTSQDGDLTVSFSDGSESLSMNRRDFLRVSGAAAATAAMTSVACRRPQRHIVPYVDRPEEVRIGITNQYASVCNACPAQCGTLVKTRAGRPFKLEGNPKHPVSRGALCARGQASYMDLYDPDRLRTPVRPGASEVSWQAVDEELVAKVAEARQGASLRILTGAITGPATQALIDTIVGDLPNARHVRYEPLADDAVLAAAANNYGDAHLPNYHFDRANLVVSFGSDFLATWLSPVEFARDFASRRDPDNDMSRLIAFEGSLTLTGINADHRVKVRPDHLPYVALAVAHELFENHRPGGVPRSPVQQRLQPFDPDSVSELTGVSADTLRSVAAQLADNAGESIVLAGGSASASPDGITLETAVNLINAALRNDGATVDRSHANQRGVTDPNALQSLLDEIEAGDVDILIIDGTNPVYSAPGGVDVAAAIESVDFVISTSTHLDETSALADLVATGCHSLEAWGDSSPRTGVYAIQQPAILPLFSNRAFEDSLLIWFGADGQNQALAQFLEPSERPPTHHEPANVPYDPGPFYRFLRAQWQSLHEASGSLASFEQFWTASLRDGVFVHAREEGPRRIFNPRRAVELLPQELPAAESVGAGDLDAKWVQLFPSIPLYDGRQANNGHLQELPDPISRHTWGSYAMVGYRTAQAANLETGQILEISNEAGDALEFPVLIIPGMHEDTIAIPLGYGRTSAGGVGNDVGSNAYRLATNTDNGPAYVTNQLSIRRLGRVERPSTIKGAGVVDIDRHRILATATLDEYKADPEANIYRTPTTATVWEDHDFGDLKWGMSIDMTKCTGCSACVIACQEENNIPVVGRQGILEGREMSWMRIDRYYELPEEALEERTLFNDPMYEDDPQLAFAEHLDEPKVVFQPMLCQHCDRAPCETVCPVLATMQSNDGLNQMSYQACVGTRYCANNCPYKVRRFNWFNYTENRTDSFFARLYPELKEHGRLNAAEPLHLAQNPDVTTRARGVMEKCSFCVQRIRRSKWEIMKDGRRTFRDGEVVTACQQSCPADAISFGNMLDEQHRVTREKNEKRTMTALSDLNTQPAVSYMTWIRNTDEELA